MQRKAWPTSSSLAAGSARCRISWTASAVSRCTNQKISRHTCVSITHSSMYLKVFATPDAKREKVEEKGDTLLVSVREPALGNRANTRIRELIALRFHTPLGKVRILTGH